MGKEPRQRVAEAYPNALPAEAPAAGPLDPHRTTPHVTLGDGRHRKIVTIGRPTVSIRAPPRVQSGVRLNAPPDHLAWRTCRP